MEGNDANRLHGPPNYATLTPQHCTQNFTLNNETIEGHQRHRDRILTHVDSSQVFNSIFPLYYSKLHLSNNTNSPNTSSNSNNNNTNADEANALLEDRTQKRMFFNRESARRSRMQRKQQIETPFSVTSIIFRLWIANSPKRSFTCWNATNKSSNTMHNSKTMFLLFKLISLWFVRSSRPCWTEPPLPYWFCTPAFCFCFSVQPITSWLIVR